MFAIPERYLDAAACSRCGDTRTTLSIANSIQQASIRISLLLVPMSMIKITFFDRSHKTENNRKNKNEQHAK